MIFRVPVDNQHFKDTIENGKPVADVIKFLSGEDRARVERIAKDGILRYWGSIPGEGNKRHFEKMNTGDELLCYRSGKYIAVARVALTIKNRELAAASWGTTELGTTWELIYFFSSVIFLSIDSNVINQEFGYSDGPVMGFSPVSEDKVKDFTIKHGSVEEFVRKNTSDEGIANKISEEVSKLNINSPFEAQFYLVDLGNQLGFETYVPTSDAGHEVFGKKLSELVTVRKDDLPEYVAPKILAPLSNIDVIWFKENYRPQFFYEVIHKSGMNEAFARLKAVTEHYETAKTRIVGTKDIQNEFEKSKRLYFPNPGQIAYKLYDDLVHVHSETLHHKNIVESFLS